MTNQAYHHLKAACVKANNETALCHLDALWRKEQDRRDLQRKRAHWARLSQTHEYAF